MGPDVTCLMPGGSNVGTDSSIWLWNVIHHAYLAKLQMSTMKLCVCVCVCVCDAWSYISFLINFLNLEKSRGRNIKYNLREVQSIVLW